MTRSEIEPRSPKPLANTQLIRPIARFLYHIQSHGNNDKVTLLENWSLYPIDSFLRSHIKLLMTRTFLYIYIYIYMTYISIIQGFIWFDFMANQPSYVIYPKSFSFIYIRYMISEHILLIRFLNEPELIFVHS